MEDTLDIEHAPRPGSPVDLQRHAVLFWRARFVLLAVFVAGVALAYVVHAWVLKPVYQASAAMVWEPPQLSASGSQQRKLRTMADSIKLPSNLSEVQKQEGLDVSIEAIGSTLTVDIRTDSNLLLINARWPDAKRAAAVANRVINVFIAHQKTLLRAHLQEVVESAEIVRDAALVEMQAARKAYDEFRQEHGILDLRAERAAVIEKATVLSSTADRARADLVAQTERVRVLSQARSRIDEKVVLSETESAPALLSLAKAKAEFEKMRGVLTDDHPRVQALSAQIKSLEDTVTGDNAPVIGQRVVGRHPQRDFIEHGLVDAEADHQAAQKLTGAYADLMAETEQQLSHLIEIEGKAGELTTVLELAEKRFADAEAAVSRAGDIARTLTTGLRMASKAIEPPHPIPNRRRTLAVALLPFLLLTFAVIGLFVIGSSGLRVSSSRELAYWSKSPVLAVTGWPGKGFEIEEVCQQLRPSLEACRGQTLVISFSDAEDDATRQLCDALSGGASHASNSADDGTDGLDNASGKRRKRSSKKRASNTDEARDLSADAGREPVEPLSDTARNAVHCWRGEDDVSRREACRGVARVLVVVRARAHSMLRINAIETRLGRSDRVGFVMISAGKDMAHIPDRVGNIDDFWS